MDLLKHFSPYVQWNENGWYNEKQLIRNKTNYERLMLTQCGELFVGFDNGDNNVPIVYQYDREKKEWEKNKYVYTGDFEFVFDPLNLSKGSIDWLNDEIRLLHPYCKNGRFVSMGYYKSLLWIKSMVDGKYTGEKDIKRMRIKQRLDGI